jgi:hypothetical protein
MEFCARFTTLSAAVTASRCALVALSSRHSTTQHTLTTLTTPHHTHLCSSDPRRPGDTVFIQPGAHMANNVVVKWPLHIIGGGRTPIDNTQLTCLGCDPQSCAPHARTPRAHTPSAPSTGGLMHAWMLKLPPRARLCVLTLQGRQRHGGGGLGVQPDDQPVHPCPRASQLRAPSQRQPAGGEVCPALRRRPPAGALTQLAWRQVHTESYVRVTSRDCSFTRWWSNSIRLFENHESLRDLGGASSSL